ncbi:MAG: hypothetical protein LBM17_08150 [Candidatus Accumulibacter sp.]|jgi:hypothetical protein|nr:hypothetical protein [Accumulibacter sp.]
MNRELAKHIARVAFQASRDIGELVPLLKNHCSADEYEKFGKVIASVSATIGMDIMKLIFKDFPELEKEFDKDIETYGRIL